MKKETTLDLDREEHIGAIREALLFCCLDRRPVEERVEDAVDALLTCARWFPTEEADVGLDAALEEVDRLHRIAWSAICEGRDDDTARRELHRLGLYPDAPHQEGS